MSTLIYCKTALAATPYYIEEASLNVYSLEELSYFMLNNVYLLSNKFMTVELCNWISRELKETKLASELMNLVQSNAPLHIFVGHLMAANGYASVKEIKDLLAIISTFENKSEAERKKLRADRLMAAEKYVDAMFEYESLLSEEIVKTIPKSTEGDIYHNLGCAFSKLFFFDEAISCFDEAYKRNKKRQSLNCLLFAAKCKKDNDKFLEYINKYQLPKDEVDDIENIISNSVNNEKIIEFDKSINELQFTGKEDICEKTSDIIDKWKEEYIKFSRI